jgi:hypothetical protein
MTFSGDRTRPLRRSPTRLGPGGRGQGAERTELQAEVTAPRLRSKEKMITIIYLVVGKLSLPEIHTM